jgi:hypothetical protein
LPSLPIRFCEKMTGPFPVDLINTASITITGIRNIRQKMEIK